MTDRRFAFVCLVEEFILKQENKNTAQKTQRGVRVLERFLKTKPTGKSPSESLRSRRAE